MKKIILIGGGALILVMGCHKKSNTDAGGSAAPSNGIPITSTTTFTLTVTKSGGGSGTVSTVDGGINCGPTCSHDYLEGSVIVLRESRSTSSLFTKWSNGCAGNLVGCVIYPFYQNSTVNAEFETFPSDPSHCTGRYVDSTGTTVYEFDAGTTCSLTQSHVNTLFCTYPDHFTVNFMFGVPLSGTFSNDCSEFFYLGVGQPYRIQ